MLALQITALKPFMSALLSGDLFDIFLLEEATLATAATYTIDGRINKAFFPPEERDDTSLHPYEFTPWSEMKGLCFDLIKGKRTPLHFQFVFHLMPAHVTSILENGGAGHIKDFVKAFVLTVRYDGEKIILCTGTSFTTFVADKEPERLWDTALKKYLQKKEIACDEL